MNNLNNTVKNKTILTYVLIVFILLTVSIIIYYCVINQTKTSKILETRIIQPPQLAVYSQFLRNANYSLFIGKCKIQIHADRIFFKKSKLLGFDCAFLKKMVLDGVTITILQNKKRLLKIFKNNVQSNTSFKKISIDHPIILLPESLKNSKKVIIDKTQKTIKILLGNEIKIWDLTTTIDLTQ